MSQEKKEGRDPYAVPRMASWKWPRGSAVAWDTYLCEPVEVCEEEDGGIICRRIFPVPGNLNTGGLGDSDGVMMPMTRVYFRPLTPLARELMKVRR